MKNIKSLMNMYIDVKITEVLISPETEKKPSLDFTPDITLRKTEESVSESKQVHVKVKKKVTVSKKMKKKK